VYPAQLFALYPPFPRENKVFVAMSFDAKFDQRWERVIAPRIRRILANDMPLEPFRVDTRTISDSILTEILAGIANSRLVFCDITTVGECNGKPMRNGNVMYEVGLAQATRLAEEVVLFRSDDDRLLFDTSTLRVNRYDPDGAPDQAIEKVASVILGALKEVDLRKHLAVRKAVEMLDYPSWYLLGSSMVNGSLSHPKMKNMGEVLGKTRWASAISNLLALGALRTEFAAMTPEWLTTMNPTSPAEDLLHYRLTEFGHAVFRECMSRMGVLSPEMQCAMEKWVSTPGTTE
jgi:hypothetical protein